ncbi:MAG: hypothetical protein OXH32_01630 [Acidobacteria bacterium]|nr:hypothetical protein [Acidobacteriota bacterium]
MICLALLTSSIPILAYPALGEEVPLSAASPSSAPRLVEDRFVETVVDNSGPIHVSVVDVEGFAFGTHGQRVRDNFLSATKRSRLVQIEGYGYYELGDRRVRGINSAGYIRHALGRGGGIFFTSTDESPVYSEERDSDWFLERGRPFYRNSRAFALWMQEQNTLFVASLENPTGSDLVGTGNRREELYCDDFTPEADGTWIPLCGSVKDYIAHSGVGLDKTLFVGAIDRFGRAAAAIRGNGVYAGHAIYVESPDDSTSNATPFLAAYATNLAFANPGWDAVRLKKELMELAVEEVLDHVTGGSNDRGNDITERRVLKVIRPAFAPKGEPPSGQPPPPEPPGPCVADAETLCLLDSRYAVKVEWRTPDGEVGAGRVVQDGTNDSGLFTFFDPSNWEILVKVLEGCSVNGHVWVYGASTTDLGYTIMVTDAATGDVRRYSNEAGRPAEAITDATAFPGGC